MNSRVKILGKRLYWLNLRDAAVLENVQPAWLAKIHTFELVKNKRKSFQTKNKKIFWICSFIDDSYSYVIKFF